MRYNFKTQRGSISLAQTEQEGAKYSGTVINKVDKETYFIAGGIYTTCEDSCPHYHFYSPTMKVIHKEQVIAKWIFLHFGGVPFPIPLPFAVFPIQSGRRSGIIPPVYGEDGRYGTYFSRMGYFWAISDYMDWNLTGDYYTRGSYRFSSLFRYAKRYEFTGNLEGSYAKFVENEQTDPDRAERIDWRFIWNHNQNITPTMRFDARLEFLSNNQIQRNISDLNEILRNQAVSSATLFKTWEESGNSMSINYNRRQVFETNEINEVLPSVIFSMSQKFPFRSESGISKNLFETFGISYSGQFQNNRDKIKNDLRIRGGISHQIMASFSPKIGYFNLSPYFSYQEKWYNKRIEKFSVPSLSGGDSIISYDIKEINFVRTFSTGVNLSTKLYGIVNPEIWGVKSIRHQVIPSVGYSFVPDFSGPFWGYYSEFVNQKGKKVKYDKFEREIFGGASGRESQSINFSVSNIFEMKTAADPTDTTSKENKIQLLNLGANIGYDFTADSLKFSDLRLNYRTHIGSFSFDGGSSFTLYDSEGSIDRINRFLIDAGKGFLRMTNFNFSISFSISGEKLKSDKPDTIAERRGEEFQLNQQNQSIYQGLYTDRDPDFSIPWDLSLSYYFNESRHNPNRVFKSSSISGSLNFNLTPAWKFSFTGSYDLERKEFSAPQIRISRDLHCWLMNFTWNPIGTFRGYRFEIRVKAPQLQDLKLTKQDQFFDGR
jgi:lipopolysaccharide assembly outer membrane protein LptD (OstA)